MGVSPFTANYAEDPSQCANLRNLKKKPSFQPKKNKKERSKKEKENRKTKQCCT